MKLYDHNEVLIGEMVDGKFVPIQTIAPAPEGEELADLVDDACVCIEKHPRLGVRAKRLDSILSPREGGRQSDWLKEHVCHWIQAGTLRSVEQLGLALTKYADTMETAVRRGKIRADWKLSLYGLNQIGAYLGVPLPPEPTPEEIAAEKARRKKDEEDSRKFREELTAHEAALEIVNRKKRLLREIASDFFTMDDLDFSMEHLPPRYDDVMEKRLVFERFSRDLVNQLVDDGKADDDIKEGMRMLHALTQGNFRSTVPEPLKGGESRHFVAAKDLANFIVGLDRDGVFEKFDSTTCLTMDGRFAVTITPKTNAADADSQEKRGHVECEA